MFKKDLPSWTAMRQEMNSTSDFSPEFDTNQIHTDPLDKIPSDFKRSRQDLSNSGLPKAKQQHRSESLKFAVEGTNYADRNTNLLNQ